MRRFLGEREDQVRVLLRSVEGRGSNDQKNSISWRLFTKTGDCLQNGSVGKFRTSGPQNSRCGKCCQVLATKTLSWGFVVSQRTFHLVCIVSINTTSVYRVQTPGCNVSWFICWFRRYINCLLAHLTSFRTFLFASLLIYFLIYLFLPE